MKQFYQFTVSFFKEVEDSKGNPKQEKVKNNYLVDAMSYTEAEARATEKAQEFAKDFTITPITKSRVENVYESTDGDRFFEVTMAILWEDDKGNLKSEKHLDLVRGNNIKQAIENIENVYSDSIENYEIPQVKESKIEDVFKYQ